MDLKTWFDHHNCLDQIRNYGSFNVYNRLYVVNIQEKIHFLKKLKFPREHDISKELETLGVPTFLRSSLLTSNVSLEKLMKRSKIPIEKKKTYYYMVSDEIKGRSLLDLIPTLSKEDLDSIIRIVIFSLRYAWEKLGFVHLDMHLGNIIIQTLQSPVTLSAKFGDHDVHDIFTRLPLSTPECEIVVERYLPVMLDFERSITKTHESSMFSNKTIVHDLWKFLGTLSLYAKGECGELVLDYIEYFIDRYEFQERKEEFANQWFYMPPKI